MTRIIAIVVVIAAAVVAYMYTSAGDVEVGEAPTHAEPSGESGGDSASPDDAAAVTNPAQEAAVEDGNVEESAEGEAAGTEAAAVGATEAEEEALIEGTGEAPEDAPVTDTAETVPAEEGPADEEPDAGVGAVSTEEETDGAGVEGIVAEEGEQQGLVGTTGTADTEAPAGTMQGTGDASQTPQGLDTTNENAPEAVIPGQDNAAESQAAGAASEQSQTENATTLSPTGAGAATTGTALPDPGPAVAAGAATGTANLDTLLDPANLDVAAVTREIRASDLEAAEQTQLVEALETARNSPDLLPAVLDRIRTALSGE